MKERILTDECIDKFAIYLQNEEKSSNTREKYMRDIKVFAKSIGNTNVTKEAVIEAIAKMTMSKMKSLYPPNSLNIMVSHIDAEVTLHFKAANKNYVPPRDIY